METPQYPQVFPFYYNDQATGINGAPDTGLSLNGDTYFTAWGPSTIWMSWNDGSGPSQASCSANMGMLTLSSNLETASLKNCMSSFGTAGQENTGDWTDGYTWKSAGMEYIDDGSTATGLYWSVMRQLDSSPFTRANGFLMYSSDGGTTWTNPAGASNTNGAAPLQADTVEFSNTPTLYFVQYEQGATGALTVDCQNSYIYAYGITGNFVDVYLLRAARGSNLQSSSHWQYYSGTVGGSACVSGNWTSSFGSATIIGGSGITTQSASFSAIYIPTYGYLLTGLASPGTIFYNAQAVTGPWTAVYEDNNAGNTFGFSTPLLNTLAIDGSGNISLDILFSGNYTGSHYAPFFRWMTIAAP